MSENDLQFQADLEKAQALSLESLALEQFRRQKLLRSAGGGGLDNGRELVLNEGPPPALPPPPRHNSRPRLSIPDGSRSTGASPVRDNNSDLISFSSPTSKTAPKDPHASLKEYIDQLNKLVVTPSEELSLNQSVDQPPNMQNQYPNNQGPRYPYIPYSPPYPYPPFTQPFHPHNPPYAIPMQYPQYPPMYQPYNQTRMAQPIPYAYPPSTPPQYNFSTTTLISRPQRPPHIYPQLNMAHAYPPYPNTTTIVKTDSARNSCDSIASKKSNESNEATDTISSLPSLNLIDLGKSSNRQGSVRVSVLEAFDPLLTDCGNNDYAVPSECSSVYEEYDPLDFLYGETEMREAPVYATVNKKETNIQPTPPPKSMPSVPAVTKRYTTNKLYDAIVKTSTRNYNSEHKAFLKMVLDVRKNLVHTDTKTNPGHVIASRSEGKYPPNTSIKIVVHHSNSDEPITFTSDVESTVDHVILTVVCSLDEEIGDDVSGYMLRVWGANEYLSPGSLVSEYEYVRECVRLEKDVRFSLLTNKDESLARDDRDDARAMHLSLDDLLPLEGIPPLTYDSLSILFETLEGELSRAIGVASAEGSCSPKAVLQAVKAICALANGIETLHITHTLNAFAQACNNQISSMTPEIVSDSGAYCDVSLRRASSREAVSAQSQRLRDAVSGLVGLYLRTQLSDLTLPHHLHKQPDDVTKAVPAYSIPETMLFCVEAVHSLPPCWTHDEYLIHGQIYHGTRPLKRVHTTQCYRVDCGGFYPRIIFDTWLNLEDMPIPSLPRECRLVLTLYGRTQRSEEISSENNQNNPQHVQEEQLPFDQEELGWTAMQLFDYEGMLASGNYILPIWPICADKRIGPAPHIVHKPLHVHPVVNIEIPLYSHNGVRWSAVREKQDLSLKSLPTFDSLDGHTQSQLLHLIEQGSYQKMPTECREILWEKRQYLVQLSGALPLVLLTATNWSGEQREQLIQLLHLWEQPSPTNAMHLLLPCFPDISVREYATTLLSALSDDELCRVLPQLTQALALETFDASPLAKMLLTKAISSPRVAHTLFWLLLHNSPNMVSNQESLGINLEENASNRNPSDGSITSGWRIRLMTKALLLLCGEQMSRTLLRQHTLVKTLSEVAQSVKAAKDGQRNRALTNGAQELANLVKAEATSLPLSLSKLVHDVDIKSCSYFASNTLPLKINFIGLDNAVLPAMFKVGDDLRQDALVLQIIRVMDTLWLKAGLDLRIVTFQALPTNARKGMIEIVSEAETLRAIQTEWGLTGSFKDKPIAEWLAKHNPSELEYQRARDNFTASCAGYSVATYLLGICDRHNDNIMLKTSGHLFHIDFGKFLGDAQMFGNFKRDRAPFVLTNDMVYVINGGDRPTQRFQHFVELCCMAFNIVRAHSSHLLDLIALMSSLSSSGIPPSAASFVRLALLPEASNAEAAAAFARLITSSLKSKFTPINFFLHNLAQMRTGGEQSNNASELLSFMPRTYTMSVEGRLSSVQCLGYEKRYDPEKHYVYALKIFREGQSTPSLLYRSYKHFTELYQKICLHFPLAKVHSLPSGLHVGRSNIRQVAERRFSDVQAFLTSLFELADEIAHSDLVYTFFHPLLRDQQDVEPQRSKNRGDVIEQESNGSGSLKLSVQYTNGVLSVLILHAQSLALTPQGLPPNPYVKVYLVPDPTKETKRKTRVLKRNSHPSFMEMLEYRLPIEVVKTRSLQATVWNYDSLQENQFLGGVVIPLCDIPLREETVAWYPLEYIPR